MHFHLFPTWPLVIRVKLSLSAIVLSCLEICFWNYIIDIHWFETEKEDIFSEKIRNNRVFMGNVSLVVLTTHGAGASAVMLLSKLNRNISGKHGRECYLRTRWIPCWELKWFNTSINCLQNTIRLICAISITVLSLYKYTPYWFEITIPTYSKQLSEAELNFLLQFYPSLIMWCFDLGTTNLDFFLEFESIVEFYLSTYLEKSRIPRTPVSAHAPK